MFSKVNNQVTANNYVKTKARFNQLVTLKSLSLFKNATMNSLTKITFAAAC